MLTARQREFLEAVVECYQDRGGPVHYTDVAEKLDVSPWTAYDLLTLLAEKGLLGIERQVDRKKRVVGRSQVLFYPTAKGYALFPSPAPTPPRASLQDSAGKESEEWRGVKRELLAELARAKEEGVTNVLKEILSELPNIRSPLLLCAHLISALILAIWAVQQNAQFSLILGHLLSLLLTPETILILLAGGALGLLLRSGRGQEVVFSLRQYLPRYVEQVRNMDRSEQAALLTFVQEATAALTSV